VVERGACNDDDACTEDSCGPSGGCINVPLPATAPQGITCAIDNVRTVLDQPPAPACTKRCPRKLEASLQAVERLLAAATNARTKRRCEGKLRAAVAKGDKLRRTMERLARLGRFVPDERGTKLVTRARELVARVRALGESDPCP
jgi:hypothetical protein